jgi:hypothetical protein
MMEIADAKGALVSPSDRCVPAGPARQWRERLTLTALLLPDRERRDRRRWPSGRNDFCRDNARARPIDLDGLP